MTGKVKDGPAFLYENGARYDAKIMNIREDGNVDLRVNWDGSASYRTNIPWDDNASASTPPLAGPTFADDNADLDALDALFSPDMPQGGGSGGGDSDGEPQPEQGDTGGGDTGGGDTGGGSGGGSTGPGKSGSAPGKSGGAPPGRGGTVPGTGGKAGKSGSAPGHGGGGTGKAKGKSK